MIEFEPDSPLGSFSLFNCPRTGVLRDWIWLPISFMRQELPQDSHRTQTKHGLAGSANTFPRHGNNGLNRITFSHPVIVFIFAAVAHRRLDQGRKHSLIWL